MLESIKDQFLQAMEEIQMKFRLPSLVACVSDYGGNLFYSSGSSDIKNQRKADIHTVYPIASVSKSFIAAALAILADRGQLDFDEPIINYLPDFEMFDPYMTKNMSIRDALCYRSGIPPHNVMRANLKDSTIYEMVHRLRYLEPAYAPRTRMCYQTLMYTLATVIVEKISGMSWQKFLRNNILDPLKMHETYLTLGEVRKNNISPAKPYLLKDGLKIKIPAFDTSNVGCAGSMYSTIYDLSTWTRFQLGNGMFNNVQICSSRYFNELHSPQIVIRSQDMPDEIKMHCFPEMDFHSYCLGWFAQSYRGHKLLYHGGVTPGFRSFIGFLPNEGAAFSVLTNLDGTAALDAAGYTICDLITGMDKIDWTSRMTIKTHTSAGKSAKVENLYKTYLDSSKVNGITGTYENPGYGRIMIKEASGKYELLIAGMKFPLFIKDKTELLVDASPIIGKMIPGKFQINSSQNTYKILLNLEPALKKMIIFDKVTND